MAKRRGNHEGSIYQMQSGTWRVQITLQGSRLNYTARTRKECQDWLKKTYRQIDDGLTFANTRITIDEYLKEWLTSIKATVRSRTLNHYEQLCRTYIFPKLGKIKLKDLRPDRIQSFYNQLLSQETGAYTVMKIHTTLHSSLGQAVKLGILSRNPARFVNPPREPATEMSILNESQVSQPLIAASVYRWEALYHLAIVSGMRQMELLGLKWTDLDWNHQTLRVERQLVRPSGGTIKFSSPKTRFGKRSIALGIRTTEVLRSHYDRQQSEMLAAGDKWQDYGLIFTNSTGGPIDPRNLLRNFKQLLQESGLSPIRFHDLRHTAASLMLNNGIAPIIVSRRLGHSRASITLDIYGHLIPSMQEEAAAIIDELVTPIPVMQSLPASIAVELAPSRD